VAARLIMEIIQAENIGLGVHFRALQSSPILPQPLRLSARAMSGGRGGIGSPRLASLASRLTDRYVEGTVTALAKALAAARNRSFRIDDDAKAAAAY